MFWLCFSHLNESGHVPLTLTDLTPQRSWTSQEHKMAYSSFPFPFRLHYFSETIRRGWNWEGLCNPLVWYAQYSEEEAGPSWILDSMSDRPSHSLSGAEYRKRGHWTWNRKNQDMQPRFVPDSYRLLDKSLSPLGPSVLSFGYNGGRMHGIFDSAVVKGLST